MISYFSKTQLYFSSKKKKSDTLNLWVASYPRWHLGFVVGGWPPIGGGRQPIDSARL